MAIKDFKFVESVPKGADNGYLSDVYKLYPEGTPGGAVLVSSLSELVSRVKSELSGADQIGQLTLYAHGAPGIISVGNGQTGSDPTKSIGLDNVGTWKQALTPLVKFVGDSTQVLLRGCHVGANTAGADLSRKFCQELGLHPGRSVRAPVTTVTADRILPNLESNDQSDNMQATTHDDSDTCVVAKTYKVSKSGPKEAGTGGIIRGRLRNPRGGPGRRFGDVADFEDVVAVRLLPVVPGVTPPLHFATRIIPRGHFEERPTYWASESLIDHVSAPLVDAYVFHPAPLATYVQAWIQFQVEVSGGSKLWLSPWGLTADGAFGLPSGGDTRQIYEFGGYAASELQGLLNHAVAEERTRAGLAP